MHLLFIMLDLIIKAKFSREFYYPPDLTFSLLIIVLYFIRW